MLWNKIWKGNPTASLSKGGGLRPLPTKGGDRSVARPLAGIHYGGWLSVVFVCKYSSQTYTCFRKNRTTSWESTAQSTESICLIWRTRLTTRRCKLDWSSSKWSLTHSQHCECVHEHIYTRVPQTHYMTADYEVVCLFRYSFCSEAHNENIVKHRT